jgi:cold shock protein
MRQRAIVVKWNKAAGWGFLAPENGDADLFVHISAIEGRRRLNEGDTVEFECGEYNGKPLAQNVTVLGGAL